MVLFLRSRKDAVLFSSYVSQHKCQVTLNLRFALCMSWRSMVKSQMRTQVFREGMPVAVRFKPAQVFVFIMNRFVNFLVSFHILIAIILTAYNEQLFLSSALKSVISLCEMVYIGVYGQLKVPPTRLRHYSLQDTFILCFRHKNLLVLSFLNDLLFFYEIHTLTHTSLHFLFQTGKETISQLVDCSPFLSLSAWNRPILCFSTHREYLNCVEFSWSKKILQWTTTKLKELFKPSRLHFSSNETYLFLWLEVFIVLCHVLRRPLLDQTATQQPDAQADHKHADIGDEHSDAIPRICTSHAGDKQTKDGTQMLTESRRSVPQSADESQKSWFGGILQANNT